MDAIFTSACVFACICVGIIFGVLVPGQRLDSDTKDVVRLGTGLIATLTSLVLGLLIGSAKESYDVKSGQVRQLTADIVLLDEILTQYGADAQPARAALRQALPPMVENIWHENESKKLFKTFHATAAGEDTFGIIQGLAPKNDEERDLKSRAVQLTIEISQTRLLLFEQSGNPIPIPFLAVLAFWLVILFASYSVFAKPNAQIIFALLVFGLSATAAIFLIIELTDPFAGLIKISDEPIRRALTAL
jgi:hypothetical protein